MQNNGYLRVSENTRVKASAKNQPTIRTALFDTKERESPMTKLLYINASPRAATSHSHKIGSAYLETRKNVSPQLEVETIDLWAANLPEFDGDKAAAKMSFFGVGALEGDLVTAWDQVVAITQKFIDADEYVFAVPMWNGGIPYKLKQYIDIITQPGLLFGFNPDDGYLPMLRDKKATMVYSAAAYAPNGPAKYGEDFHSTYLDWWLKMIGVETINEIRFQPSLITADAAGEEATAIEAAITLAKSQV